MSKQKKESVESAPVIEKKKVLQAPTTQKLFLKDAPAPIPASDIIARKEYDGYSVVVTKKGQKFKVSK